MVQEPLHKFNTILIGFAFSPNLRNNIFEAMRMVDFFDSQLILVHCGEKTIKKESEIKELIFGLDESEEDEDCNKVTIVWEQGDPVTVILNNATTHKADLIMLGASAKEKLLTYYMGSIARKITRNATCSVLLLIKPSEDLRPCKHIVVNGLQHEQTKQAIIDSFEIGQNLGVNQITIVEEISSHAVQTRAVDDASLRKDTLLKEKLRRIEDQRVCKILEEVPRDYKYGIKIKTQSIFGRRGYSIGHYARVVKADLLIMNAPTKISFWNRLFTKDLEYILSELPTDVLIIR